MLGTEYKIIIEISIHAPTRGATGGIGNDIFQASISIHAPTRGATCEGAKTCAIELNFNPRSYKRSDSKNAQYSLCISAIIIA